MDLTKGITPDQFKTMGGTAAPAADLSKGISTDQFQKMGGEATNSPTSTNTFDSNTQPSNPVSSFLGSALKAPLQFVATGAELGLKVKDVAHDIFGTPGLTDTEQQELASHSYDTGSFGSIKSWSNPLQAAGGGAQIASFMVPLGPEVKGAGWLKNLLTMSAPFAISQTVGGIASDIGEGKSGGGTLGDAALNYLGSVGGMAIFKGLSSALKMTAGALLKSEIVKSANQGVLEFMNKALSLDGRFAQGANITAKDAALQTKALEDAYEPVHKQAMDAFAQSVQMPTTWDDVYRGVQDKVSGFFDNMVKAKDAKYASVFTDEMILGPESKTIQPSFDEWSKGNFETIPNSLEFVPSDDYHKISLDLIDEMKSEGKAYSPERGRFIKNLDENEFQSSLRNELLSTKDPIKTYSPSELKGMYSKTFPPQEAKSTFAQPTFEALNRAKAITGASSIPSDGKMSAEEFNAAQGAISNQDSPLSKYVSLVESKLGSAEKPNPLSMKDFDQLFTSAPIESDPKQNKAITDIATSLYDSAKEALSSSGDAEASKTLQSWNEARTQWLNIRKIASTRFFGDMKNVGDAQAFVENMMSSKPSVYTQKIIDGLDKDTKGQMSDIIYNMVLQRSRSMNADYAVGGKAVENMLDSWSPTGLIDPLHESVLRSYASAMQGTYDDAAQMMSRLVGSGDKAAEETIGHSEPFDVQGAISSGEVPKESVYNGEYLKPEFAQGRVDDIAQKLDLYKPGLGQVFRDSVDVTKVTMKGNSPEELVTKAQQMLEEAKSGTGKANELLQAAQAAQDKSNAAAQLQKAMGAKDLYKINEDGSYDFSNLAKTVDKVNNSGEFDQLAKYLDSVENLDSIASNRVSALVKGVFGVSMFHQHPFVGLGLISSSLSQLTGKDAAKITTADIAKLTSDLIKTGKLQPQGFSKFLTQMLAGNFREAGGIIARFATAGVTKTATDTVNPAPTQDEMPDWFAQGFKDRTGTDATPEHWADFNSSLQQ